MKNRNLSSRTARGAGVVGVSAIAAVAGIAVAAAPASADSISTGWQCISPFANFTNNTFPDDPPAPSGILDSLAVSVTRPGGEALVANPGQALGLRDLQVGLSFKDPRVVEQLYTRTGGVSLSYRGAPLGQPSGTTTSRTLAKTTVAAPLPAATTTNPGGGTAPAAGESWWTFSVSNTTAATAANLNTGWYKDGTANAAGNFTRTYYVEKVDGTAPPQNNAGSYLEPTASVGHKYVTHTGNNHFPINVWVVVKGTNTAEGTQTVQAKGYWTVNVQDTTPGSLAAPAGYGDGGHTVTVPDVTLDVPRSNWTPTGAGPVEFTIAPPGNAKPVQIESKGYDFPGYNRPVTVKPFGSVFIRADTEAYGATNDCIPGTIGIKDSTIGASFWGDARPDATADNPDKTIGDVENPGFFRANTPAVTWNVAKGAAGRFEFGFDAQPALAVAALPQPAVVVPTVPAPAPTPTPAPVYVAKAPTVSTSSAKKTKSNMVKLSISNPNAKNVRYAISGVTVSKYKVGKSAKKTWSAFGKKTVTITAGKSRSQPVRLTSALKSLLKKRSSVRVKVTIKPTDSSLAKTITKTVTIKR